MIEGMADFEKKDANGFGRRDALWGAAGRAPGRGGRGGFWGIAVRGGIGSEGMYV